MADSGLKMTGLSDALDVLRSYQGAEMENRIRVATRAGASSLREPIKAATPVLTGALRASVTVRQIKSDGKWIGYKTTPGGQGARHANLVIGGTKDHAIYGEVGHPLGLPWGPRAVVHVRGARPNPYIQRVGDAEGDTVLNAVAKSIAKQQRKRGF